MAARSAQVQLDLALREKASLVDKEIYKLVDTLATPLLREPIMHTIKAGGKRLRPAITLLSCEAVGADQKFALAPAISIELVHTASLIHDDIIDGNFVRRGKPTVHTKWDLHTGVLAGDAMMAMAIRALTIPIYRLNFGDMMLSYVSDDIVAHLAEFAKAWTTVCEGKKLDIKRDYERITEAKVFDLMYKKSAILFELAAKMGASYGGANPKDIRHLAEYGKKLGLAFQIRDDILGMIGDEKTFGKHVGVDIREGKKTLLVAYTLNNGDARAKRLLRENMARPDVSQDKIEEIVDALKRNGAIDYARERARELKEEAKSHLESAQLVWNRSRNVLFKIADFVTARAN